MTNEATSDQMSKPVRRPFQFSLAALFFVTALVAVAFGVCFTLPDMLAGFLVFLLIMILPAIEIVAMKYGSGSLPPFCIGAIFPSGMCLIGILFDRTWTSLFNSMSGSYGLGLERTPWHAIGDWLIIVSSMGRFWRPMAVTSWFAAAFIGLVCVGVRWLLQRRQ